MVEDRPDHDPSPTDDESAWMAMDAVRMIVKALALGGIALCVGFTAAMLLDDRTEPAAPRVSGAVK